MKISSIINMLIRYLHIHFNFSKRPSIVGCVAALALGFALLPAARAEVLAPYMLSDFSLINDNADGTAITPDLGMSIVLTGGNNGSGLSGTTDLVVRAVSDATIQFQYSYSSLDLPGFDSAGYILGDVFTQLADTDGETGLAMFSVTAGQIFGLRIATFDNIGEPGILTITEAPESAPEPATWLLVAAAMAVVTVGKWQRTRFQAIQEGSK